jgi:hypothetical protein
MGQPAGEVKSDQRPFQRGSKGWFKGVRVVDPARVARGPQRQINDSDPFEGR